MNNSILSYFDKNSQSFDKKSSNNDMLIFERYNEYKLNIIKEIYDNESFIKSIKSQYECILNGSRVTSIVKGGSLVCGVKDWKSYGKKMINNYIEQPTIENFISMNVKIKFIEEYIFETKNRTILENFILIKKIRNTLINKNQRLVYSIVKKYKVSPETELDLLQEGSLGLIHSIDMFNPYSGIKFSTYSSWWIRQHISKNISKFEKTIHIPYGVETSTSKAISLFEKYNNVKIVAEKMKIDADMVFKLLGSTNSCSSLNIQANDESHSEIQDFLIDDTCYEDYAINYQFAHKLLSKLDERESTIITLRYGLNNGKEHTLDEVGRFLGITRERARQIEKIAIAKMG